jgi:hypothetical protein
MSKNVADVLWEMLRDAGVKRCFGIVGDALNPVIDALHRNGKIEFIHVRHEEYGGFAALAEALAYKDGPVVMNAVVDPFALSLPSHVPFHTVKGCTLSLAKQVLTDRMDTVFKTIERNVRLI